jgi:ABC-2 type transport system permease protein
MTTATTLAAPRAGERPEVSSTLAVRAFLLILWRDVFVTVKQFPVFLTQVVAQPFFFLFIFGKVLGTLGLTQAGFAAILLPGMVGLQAFFSALQDTATPLMVEFSYTREIEDRLLAPIPVWLVGAEKMVFGTLRGTLAGLITIPLGLLVLDDVHWSVSALPGVLLVIMLGCLVSAAIGLLIGTSVPPNQISIMMSIVLLPLMFTGSTSFPWMGLGQLVWFQVICAMNPLTYLSEGLRVLVVPGMQSIPLSVDLAVLAAAAVVFALLGLRSFTRRAID